MDFSVNTNPLGTPESVRLAAAEALQVMDRYPDPYCRELVSAVAAHEQLPESNILCGCGAAELIYSYCAAVKPQKALELAPTFSEYSAALETVGCQAERYVLSGETGFAVTEDFLEYLKGGCWDTLFLCNPNNPTGRLIEPALLKAAAEICGERGIRLFADECFLDLTDREEDSLKPLLSKYPNLLILKAFTKSYGMAGLRLGYCLSADGSLLAAMGKTVQPWNVSLPAQAAGAAACKETAFLKRARELIRIERTRLQQCLTELGIRVIPSEANYLLFYSPLPLKDLLLEQGILIRDCSNYAGLETGWYRIAVRRQEENEKLITALKGAIYG